MICQNIRPNSVNRIEGLDICSGAFGLKGFIYVGLKSSFFDPTALPLDWN